MSFGRFRTCDAAKDYREAFNSRLTLVSHAIAIRVFPLHAGNGPQKLFVRDDDLNRLARIKDDWRGGG